MVRYGELALKSPPVRREFERTLRRNLLDHFVANGLSCRVRSDRGHLYLDVDDARAAARVARRVFGVTSVSPATDVPTDKTAIAETLLVMAEPLLPHGQRFAVRARRTGQHPFTSQELAAELGGVIFDRWPDRDLHVDLDDPQTELHVEVRGPRTYLYTERFNGPGGLPLGVAGRVVALVDGPRGALGAYLMMKRGCACAFLVPSDGAPEWGETLARLDPHAKMRVQVEGGPNQDEVLIEMVDSSRADGIVLPLAVDGFTDARARWGDRVLFSPTVGLTDGEVTQRWNAVRELAQ
jgi:thiamine biosynthesis protein ThiI